MIIEIADNLLEKSKTTKEDIRLIIAIALFKEEVLTLGQAAGICDLPQLIFQKELAKRRIPVHYDVEELHKDLQNIGYF